VIKATVRWAQMFGEKYNLNWITSFSQKLLLTNEIHLCKNFY
jgi:hypothetical protein